MKPCTNALYVSLISRCDSAAIVPNTSDDLPDPDTPVNTVSRRLGIATLTSLRLFSRAPWTRIRSWVSARCDFASMCGDHAITRASRHLPGRGRDPATARPATSASSSRVERRQRERIGLQTDAVLVGDAEHQPPTEEVVGDGDGDFVVTGLEWQRERTVLERAPPVGRLSQRLDVVDVAVGVDELSVDEDPQLSSPADLHLLCLLPIR